MYPKKAEKFLKVQNIDDTGIRNYNRDRNKRGEGIVCEKEG